MKRVLVLTADMIVRPGDRVIATRVQSRRQHLAHADKRARELRAARERFG